MRSAFICVVDYTKTSDFAGSGFRIPCKIVGKVLRPGAQPCVQTLGDLGSRGPKNCAVDCANDESEFEYSSTQIQEEHFLKRIGMRVEFSSCRLSIFADLGALRSDSLGVAKRFPGVLQADRAKMDTPKIPAKLSPEWRNLPGYMSHWALQRRHFDRAAALSGSVRLSWGQSDDEIRCRRSGLDSPSASTLGIARTGLCSRASPAAEGADGQGQTVLAILPQSNAKAHEERGQSVGGTGLFRCEPSGC
jgi:hypothetical protein